MKFYFDMNIYNRIFDNQNQLRVKLETIAIDIIFAYIVNNKHKLFWSFILEDENNDNPFDYRRKNISAISQICTYIIQPQPEILNLAKDICGKSNIKVKDALHIACAAYNKCDYFITCDDKLIRIFNKANNEIDLMKSIKLINPVDFVREEANIDVIG